MKDRHTLLIVNPPMKNAILEKSVSLCHARESGHPVSVFELGFPPARE
jgi:hypothetical protein